MKMQKNSLNYTHIR